MILSVLRKLLVVVLCLMFADAKSQPQRYLSDIGISFGGGYSSYTPINLVLAATKRINHLSIEAGVSRSNELGHRYGYWFAPRFANDNVTSINLLLGLNTTLGKRFIPSVKIGPTAALRYIDKTRPRYISCGLLCIRRPRREAYNAIGIMGIAEFIFLLNPNSDTVDVFGIGLRVQSLNSNLVTVHAIMLTLCWNP